MKIKNYMYIYISKLLIKNICEFFYKNINVKHIYKSNLARKVCLKLILYK